jgi:AcrR family transcriptional regulator
MRYDANLEFAPFAHSKHIGRLPAENRQTVINAASRLFREHGFDGIGLKDLMEGAGLTQGAFYKQFASKEDLAAQASRRAWRVPPGGGQPQPRPIRRTRLAR